MQNKNRKQKKQSHRKHKDFTWFNFWPIFTSGVKKKISLTKGGDYKNGTLANLNPKYI